MIRHYVFDIGNVILRFDFSLAASRVAGRCEVAEAEILPLLEPMYRALETGRMSAEDFIAEAGRRVGFSGETAELRTAFQDIFSVNDPIAELVAELDAERRALYLLSNTSDLHVPWFTREYRSVFDRFHGAVYSHEAGVMKPDPEIFRIAAEKFGIEPSETFYADDLPANVEAAEASGFRALVYDHRDHAGFLKDFDALHRRTPGFSD